MWRFLLPSAVMVSATLLLIAGALGDLSSWRNDWPITIPRIDLPRLDISHQDVPRQEAPRQGVPRKEATAPATVPAPPTGPAPTGPAPIGTASSRAALASDTTSDPNRDSQRRKAQDLRGQIADGTRDLAALRATAEQTRQDLAVLSRQREQEQAALAQAEAKRHALDEHQQAAPPPSDRAAIRTGEPAVIRGDAQGRNDTRGTTNSMSEVGDKGGVVAAQLTKARVALSSGHRARARRHLDFLRTQIARAPDQPIAGGTGQLRGRVEYAIALLDRGDRGGALQAIDQALVTADSGLPVIPAPVPRLDRTSGAR